MRAIVIIIKLFRYNFIHKYQKHFLVGGLKCDSTIICIQQELVIDLDLLMEIRHSSAPLPRQVQFMIIEAIEGFHNHFSKRIHCIYSLLLSLTFIIGQQFVIDIRYCTTACM